MTSQRIVEAILVIASGLLLARLGPAAIAVWRIYAGTGRRRQVDATNRAPAAPSGVRDRLALFGDRGYSALGITGLALPGGERFAWIVAADDAASYAILAGAASGMGMSGIYSAWPDGTWLGTLHPIGAATDRPGLQVRVVGSTIDDAIAVHQAGMERLRLDHGHPRPIRTMVDMLALDADYRERFGGSRLRSRTFRSVGLAILAAAVFLLAAFLLVSTSP
jgi:hypothetical protein